MLSHAWTPSGGVGPIEGDRRCLAPSMEARPESSDASQVWTPSGCAVLKERLRPADGEDSIQRPEPKQHERDDDRAPVLPGSLALAEHP